MFSLPLRRMLFVVSGLLAIVVVGGMSLMTFFIVSEGMRDIYRDASQTTAVVAASVVSEAARESAEEARKHVANDVDAVEYAQRDFIEGLDKTLTAEGFAGVRFSVWDAGGRRLWRTPTGPNAAPLTEERAEALASGEAVEWHERDPDWWRGVFRDAKMGESVWQVPVSLPDGSKGVLAVRRLATAEESVIDDLRLPMLALAITTAVIMVLLMQTSLLGALRLVDTLRDAADSIQAGRLDARLPEIGNNEIGALAASINRLLERLQRRSNAQTQFVADASHELATPVAGIRGYTSILRGWGGDDPEIRQEAIDAIDRESRRMARLTSNLLNLLHADQGLKLRTERFDLNAIIRERLAASANRYAEKDLEYVGPVDDQLWMTGDPDRVEDVLGILIDNAGKYTEPGGSIVVESRVESDEIVVRVSDTGKGIAADELPHLFDRFYRAERARSGATGGFGLGLAIAKSIVDNMESTLEVESELGRGTTFTFRVPRKKA